MKKKFLSLLLAALLLLGAAPTAAHAADAVFSFPDALGEAAVTKVFLLDAHTDAPLCPACPVSKPKGGA